MKPYDCAVVCYNERFCIRRCLTSIQTYTDYEELIVVDDKSTDGTAEVAETFADVFITSGEHKVGVSRQLALENSGAPVLLYVDGDVEVVRRVDPIIRAVKGRYAVVRGKNWQLMAGRTTNAYSWGVGFGLTAIDVEVARSVGGFPAMGSGEDLAFCRRVGEAGYRCKQVGERVYGIHYKSDYAVLPPREKWPCSNFDALVEAMADIDGDQIRAQLAKVDGWRIAGVVAEAVQYGVHHQLRKRRAIVL